MQIAIFGASGRVGRQVVELALAENIRVVAFVHSQNPFESRRGVSVIRGEISDKEAVAKAVKDCQAVISCLGSWGTKDKNILSEGMRTIIPAMQAANIDRIITLTGSGAAWSGDKQNFFDKSSHLFLGLVAPKILHDGEDHLQQLDASNLDWTCIRSPVMNSKDISSYKLDYNPPSLISKVPRSAVAKCLFDQLTNQNYIRQAPHIHKD